MDAQACSRAVVARLWPAAADIPDCGGTGIGGRGALLRICSPPGPIPRGGEPPLQQKPYPMSLLILDHHWLSKFIVLAYGGKYVRGHHG